MNRTFLNHPLLWVLCSICFVGLLVLIGFWQWSNNTRYYLQGQSDGTTVKIDRKNGLIWRVQGAEETPIATPRELDYDIVDELHGKGKYDSGHIIPLGIISSKTGQKEFMTVDQLNSVFKGDIYNGSDWYITEIEVNLTNHSDTASSPKAMGNWEREFREKVKLDPKSNGTVSIYTIDGHTHEATNWRIKRAWGYKP